MSGELDLEKLLRFMEPKLLAESFVFCTTTKLPIESVMALYPVSVYQEDEGLSLILAERVARSAGLEFDTVFRCITLSVHSSLNAVGLTAAVASKLSINGISANVVAAYYHDHIYVPEANAEQALALLNELKA